MRATLSKNFKFIQLSEKPMRAEVQGFKIYHKMEGEYHLPVTTTNLIVGKLRYYLHRLPKELRETIYKLEIKNGDEWQIVPIKLTAHQS